MNELPGSSLTKPHKVRFPSSLRSLPCVLCMLVYVWLYGGARCSETRVLAPMERGNPKESQESQGTDGVGASLKSAIGDEESSAS